MKISLVIPAYNEEKYIGTCLEYAVRNSGHFHEIIVVDNASTDSTADIVRQFALDNPSAKIRVALETQKGLTKARQRGFIEASGDVLAYVDADTRMPPGWLEQVEKEFAGNPNLAGLSGPYHYYDASALQNVLVKLYWLIAWPAYFIIGYMMVGGNFAISRKALEKIGGFDTSIAFYGEDTDIARRASKFGKVKFKIRLVMPTSARRLKGQGFFSTAKVYVVNFLSQVIAHKPADKEYLDIR